MCISTPYNYGMVTQDTKKKEKKKDVPKNQEEPSQLFFLLMGITV